MSLATGNRLGPYEILAPLGAGGMGEVYRARDTKLGREVALKLLPESVSRDPERMARFDREAQVLAQLNHPNIATLYGVEEADGMRALVMELVEGPTLADRIAQGPLPLAEALPIARQIAEALEEAHDKGVTHRDLKPANVKVRHDGTAKVLDFGLAKALGEDPLADNLENSPTRSVASPTRAGVILGTAPYMSPEQAKGLPVDRRTDIWAFAVVLIEMVTGRRMYTGDTSFDVMAAVVRDEPVIPEAPPAIQKLLRRCLDKDPRRRLQAMGEARLMIEDVLSGQVFAEMPPLAAALGGRAGRPWGWMAVAALALLGFATVSFLHFREAPPPAPQPLRFSIYPPEKTSVDTFHLSPDGRYLAMALEADRKTALWVRPLDSLDAQRLPGTEEARFPFWSPDSRYIGFFAGGKLKKIAVTGGPAQTLCDAPGASGGSWNPEGVILFNRSGDGPLQRVPAAGGVPAPVASEKDSSASPRFVSFLPDGRQFLYTHVRQPVGIYAGSLAGTAGRQLLPDISSAAYAPRPDGRNGYLLFVREETLMAQPFDPGRLQPTGDLFPVAEHISSVSRSNKRFSASPAGVLAYVSGEGAQTQPVWFDREGKRLGVSGEPGNYAEVRLSPDQQLAALIIGERSSPNTDLWVSDLARGATSRLTFSPFPKTGPAWSPDGRRIAFSYGRGMYQKPASGSGGEELLLKGPHVPVDWSRDGRYILYETGTREGVNLAILPLGGDRKPVTVTDNAFVNADGRFSPDGRWIAYASNESGRYEVYIRPNPLREGALRSDTAAKWQISTAGGLHPDWRGDSQELFLLTLDQQLVAVSITSAGAALQAGIPRALFQTQALPTGPGRHNSLNVTPDGRRFLINTIVGDTAPQPITVVVNWQAALAR